MITSNKHLLYILGVDQTQLEYILANLIPLREKKLIKLLESLN